MPTIKYQDDKYFRVMMLSLLIHDFIHDYGALGSLNRIKSLEHISEDIFDGKITGSGQPKVKLKDKQKQFQIEKKKKIIEEQRQLRIELKRMGVDNDYIDHEINDIINYFNAPDSKFTEISEYEYSPEIISFLVENVSEFDIETFSVDINKPITRSITAENIKTIRSILDNENSISNSLSSTQGIKTLLQAIILVRSSYSNKKLIGLFQHIYQYIEHTTFRIMGIQETTFDEIKEKRKVGKPQKGGNNVLEPTLVEPPLVEPKLSFEPKEQTVFNIPIKNNVEVDNIQNVLNAIIDDTVINDNIKDMKSEEIYHALNMIGDDNNIHKLNHLQFVNKTIHQIVKQVYTFFLQREYTNK